MTGERPESPAGPAAPETAEKADRGRAARSTPRRFARRAAGIAAALFVVAWLVLGVELEGLINRVEPVDLPEVSERARALHAGSFVADLHADSLLFERDLLRRGRLGHVDLPRLQEGGVALQVLGLPTTVYFGTNIDRTEARGLDLLTAAGLAKRSRTALQSPMERALYHAARAEAFARASEGQLVPILDRADLARLLAARARGEAVVGYLLALEGAHALESDPANLRRAFDAGYRMIGLSHFFDNDYAGSSAGVARSGLTPLGRATLTEMERLGIAADLAHLSPAAVDDVLAVATKPVVVSHTGVRGTCDNARNLSDDQLRRIAARGGVIGLGFWGIAACGTRPADIARSIAHVVRIVGADHAALGSDYDGATTVGFDVRRLASLTQALVDVGLSEAQIRKVLGENARRLLAATLPAPSPSDRISQAPSRAAAEGGVVASTSKRAGSD
ncbi:MAG: membrane dipeptidase [Deltaproteobacteria bacterium]|nr:membrane dipeptidase [Deltaproteobacteria bacterium]